MAQVQVTYFDKPGRTNTDATLELARKRADELGIGTIIVASSSGATGIKACHLFQGKRVVVISSFTGDQKRGEQRLSEGTREAIEELGGVVVTASHVFSGVGRAFFLKFGTASSDEVVRGTLYAFGQGMKVVCEIALMAADAGVVRTDEDVISIGGTGKGADTAVVLRPANMRDLFDLKVREILCKPRL
jgi:hypothetical protein